MKYIHSQIFMFSDSSDAVELGDASRSSFLALLFLGRAALPNQFEWRRMPLNLSWEMSGVAVLRQALRRQGATKVDRRHDKR